MAHLALPFDIYVRLFTARYLIREYVMHALIAEVVYSGVRDSVPRVERKRAFAAASGRGQVYRRLWAEIRPTPNEKAPSMVLLSFDAAWPRFATICGAIFVP